MLLLPLLALVCLFFLCVGVISIVQSGRMLEKQTEHQAQTILEAIQGALEVSRDPLELQRQVTVIGGERQIKGITVALAVPTRIIASTRHAWLGRHLDDIPEQEELKALRQVLREGGRLTLQHDSPPTWQFVGEISLTNTGQATGQPIRAAVSVVLDAAPALALQQRHILFLLLAMALVLAGAALVTWRLLKRHVIMPVETMAEAVCLRARGNDGVRIPIQADDEIGMLGRALNSLLEAEEAAQQRSGQEQALARTLFNLHAQAHGQPEATILEQALQGAMQLTQSRSGRILAHNEDDSPTVVETGAGLPGCRIEIEEEERLCLCLELGDKPQGYDEDDDRRARHVASETWQILRRQRLDKALKAADARFRRMIETTQEGVWIFDEELRVTYANQRTCDMLLQPLERMLGRPVSDFIPGAEEDDHRRQMELRRQGVATVYERRFLRGDGTQLWCLVSASPMLDDEGRFAGSFAMLGDISQIKRTEEELKLAAHVYDDSPNAIAITDAQFRVHSVNAAFTKITGFSAEETLGRPATFLDNRLRLQCARLGPGERWQGEIWNQRKSGEIYPEWLSLSPVTDSQGRTTHFVAIIADLTERKEAESRIDYLANHDPLTGLPNRLLFQSRTDQALSMASEQNRQAALLLLNVDRFKTINDSLGHLTGDKLLQGVAGRLRQCVRETDTVSRQGGDEFIIVLTGVDSPDEAGRVAAKILDQLDAAFDVDGQQLRTSFSIGIALFPEDGHDPETLMKNADTAMYHAKESGRNTYRFFDERMNVNTLERLQLENGLRQAIGRQELRLAYQAQVDLASGRIIGLEALLRWASEPLGNVPPSRFIPLAEECGLIIPIGDWVLREACRQARQWQDAGLAPVPVGVNLSALQFRRSDIVAGVAAALDESGLDGRWLELELTESLLMESGPDVILTLGRLKALGVRLSIDDFGTGYSSLAYLKRFPVDRLKIDQSFVRDLAQNPDDAVIIRTIIQLGHNLRLEVIAEGTETLEQMDFLRREGCTAAQGYLFSRPVPADAIPALLQRGLPLNR